MSEDMQPYKGEMLLVQIAKDVSATKAKVDQLQEGVFGQMGLAQQFLEHKKQAQNDKHEVMSKIDKIEGLLSGKINSMDKDIQSVKTEISNDRVRRNILVVIVSGGWALILAGLNHVLNRS